MKAIKFTANNDYACSLCERTIPTKNNVLQDWGNVYVFGMFCSQTCAEGAGNTVWYQNLYSVKGA